MTVTAGLTPKNAGNKYVEWSLDVGEDIATINAKGQVKISKEAEAGTVFSMKGRPFLSYWFKSGYAPERNLARTYIQLE